MVRAKYPHMLIYTRPVSSVDDANSLGDLDESGCLVSRQLHYLSVTKE